MTGPAVLAVPVPVALARRLLSRLVTAMPPGPRYEINTATSPCGRETFAGFGEGAEFGVGLL
jgi:hypothetical protein